ncbi:uncharacterized protein Npc2e [Battus philenor]|uniref:uncharacterized protein Npc2e n=1 Tax=Battus philenor TaxID=42288 RepID=UPI0035CEA0D8
MNANMLSATVLLCAVAVAAGQSTAVSQCLGAPIELPLNTHVEGCDTPPCLLPQRQDAVIHLVFKSPHVARNMTSTATAFVNNFALRYPLGEQANTCNFLTNTYCPVLEGEVVAYTLRFYVESFFPTGVLVFLEFRVLDHNSQPLLCTRFGLQVVPPVAPVAPTNAFNSTSSATCTVTNIYKRSDCSVCLATADTPLPLESHQPLRISGLGTMISLRNCASSETRCASPENNTAQPDNKCKSHENGTPRAERMRRGWTGSPSRSGEQYAG